MPLGLLQNLLEGYTDPLFQKLDGQKGNTWEHLVFIFDSMRAFAHDAELCMREFSKSLTD